MSRKRRGYFPFLGFVLVLVVLVSVGCQQLDRQTYVEAAESGWTRWSSDRRPVLDDAAYLALPEEARPLYLPQSLVNAREFERREALRLLRGPETDNERD